MSLLELSDVETYYGESHILQGVDLSVDEDEVVALLGRNGVGKTTTMRSILQLTPPRTGSVRFKGEELVGKDTYEVATAGIGWIPEERRMFARLSVRENILAAIPEAVDTESALRTAYDRFPILEERKSQRAGDLSGGQQQMLAIARGLVGENDLLLVDEPSEGLAPKIVTDVGKALLDAAADQSILLVEQKLGLALDLADRFYVMDHGTIIDAGDTADVTPEDERLRRYLSA
jgi:branched-chain amino acid transport system ATP-binding protein